MHTITFGVTNPRTTPLRATRPGDIFVFEEARLGVYGPLLRAWSDVDDKANGAYLLVCVADPRMTWRGSKGSSLLDSPVRILTTGESFTVTVGQRPAKKG